MKVHPKLDLSAETDPRAAAAIVADRMVGKSGLLPVIVAEGCGEAVADAARRVRAAGQATVILDLRTRYARGPETALRGDLSQTASGMAEAEIVDPGPGSDLATTGTGLIPVLRFTMPDRPGAKFGVAADGRLLIRWDGGWRTSAHDGGDAGVVRAALRAAIEERDEWKARWAKWGETGR